MSDKCFFTGTLTPAYGRDYPSQDKVLHDLNRNWDFMAHMMLRAELINLEQLADGSNFSVRYGKLTKVMRVKITNGKAIKSKR